VKVRAAVAADLDAMTDLLGVLFAQETEFHPDRATQRRGLEAVLASPAAAALVSEEGGRVLGMVCLLRLPSTALGATVAVLEDLVVAPPARGRGIGTALLDAAVARCRDDGCARITLLTDRCNDRAQALFRRAGFRPSSMLAMRRMLKP